MNVLSLFDGISTGRLALEMAGVKVDTYLSSEIEETPMRISAANWPDVIQLGDVKNIDVSALPQIDLLIGGSPCQGFSRAGRHLNFEDPRSALFFEYVRVLREVREKNPAALFLLENVAMKKEWEDIITENLGVSPIHINSRLVAAQNRPRTYWTNIPGVSEPIDRSVKLTDVLETVDTTGFIEKDGLLFSPAISEAARNLVHVENGEVRVQQATKAGYIVAEDGDGINLAFPSSTTRRGRVVKQKSNTLDCSCEGCVFHDGVIREFTITELERLQTLPDGYTAKAGAKESERKKAIGNGWTAAAIAWIFQHIQKGQTDMDANEAKKQFIWAWTAVKREGKKEFMTWLEVETDFFRAPASAGHHGAFEGGLLVHSVNVYNRLRQIAVRDLTDPNQPGEFHPTPELEESMAIMGLLHDLCKVGVYHQETKRRRNPDTGTWEDYVGYTYRDPFPLGHGEKSVFLINRFMKLTEAEALAIRWHMGAYDFAARGGSKTLDAAMDATPWVWRLHEADMCASNIDEREAAT